MEKYVEQKKKMKTVPYQSYHPDLLQSHVSLGMKANHYADESKVSFRSMTYKTLYIL